MSKRLVNDIVFYGQIALALLFWWLQIDHMINHSTEGLSASMFFFTGLFISVNLALSIDAYRSHKSKATGRAVFIYTVGTIIYFSFLAVLVYKSETAWDSNDTNTTILVVAFTAIVSIASIAKGFPILDPMAKGAYGLVFKSVPQVIMAWKILMVGGGGLDPIMVVIFHLLTLSRIWQIWQSILDAGWDRNRKGLLLSETGNETTWTLVTIAWIWTM